MFITKKTLDEIFAERQSIKDDLHVLSILLTKEMWEKIAEIHSSYKVHKCWTETTQVFDENGENLRPITTLKEAIEKHKRKKEFEEFSGKEDKSV